MIHIGTAGWSLYKAADRFPDGGTNLERYASVLRAVEVNTSFYRPHARSLYAKWAASTPRAFRFAVKVPQAITHEGRLRRARRPFERFLAEVGGLGSRLGPLLVQLPPSLDFEARVARVFFGLVRELHPGPVVCEPRHASWFTTAADDLLARRGVSRVAADPVAWPAARQPGGALDVVYYRLHGSPRRYWSSYDESALQSLARQMREVRRGVDCWCIFDNTAGGGALPNALRAVELTGSGRRLRLAGAVQG